MKIFLDSLAVTVIIALVAAIFTLLMWCVAMFSEVRVFLIAFVTLTLPVWSLDRVMRNELIFDKKTKNRGNCDEKV